MIEFFNLGAAGLVFRGEPAAYRRAAAHLDGRIVGAVQARAGPAIGAWFAVARCSGRCSTFRHNHGRSVRGDHWRRRRVRHRDDADSARRQCCGPDIIHPWRLEQLQRRLTLGIMIPPSILLVFLCEMLQISYGYLCSPPRSIRGSALAGLYLLYIATYAFLNPAAAPKLSPEQFLEAQPPSRAIDPVADDGCAACRARHYTDSYSDLPGDGVRSLSGFSPSRNQRRSACWVRCC